MTSHYVLPYVNPDTDGVCSAIAYAEFLTKARALPAEAVIFGKIDSETTFVLSFNKVSFPKQLTSLYVQDRYYVVDTHQINQLPPQLSIDSVVEVWDHHPVGDTGAFLNAVIVNEQVGAVATLIVEQFLSLGIEPALQTAALLFSAIVSNTLEFKAPTTTSRDRLAAEHMSQLITIPDNYVNLMFEARSNLDGRSTLDILLSDYKEFDFSGIKVGIAQLETVDLGKFLSREDLFDTLLEIYQNNQLDHVLFNGADIRKEKGALIAYHEATRQMLAKTVGAKFSGNIAYFDRILLRKSDLIPQCKQYFS